MSGTRFTMNNSGKDLARTFKDLDIETNISDNALSAWFDTDSEEERCLLTWLCLLDKNNVLLPMEKLEVDEISKRGSLLRGEECERELNKILLEYPQLMDVEGNLLDVRLLENENEMLEDEESKQEMLFGKNKQISDDLSKQLTELSSKELRVSITKDTEYEACKELSTTLDLKLHKLQTQLIKASSNLHCFERAPKPLFISNIDIEEYLELSRMVNSRLNMFLEEQGQCWKSQMSAVVNSTAKCFLPTKCYPNEIQSLAQRISRSILDCLQKQTEEEGLKAKLEYLTNYTCSQNLDKSFNMQCQLETEIEVEERLNAQWKMDLKSYAHKLSSIFAYSPMLDLARHSLESNEKRLTKLISLKETLKRLLQYQDLLHLLHKTEQKDISNMDKYFKDVVNYIFKDLKSCEARTAVMLQKKKAYADFQEKLIEERCSFIKNIAVLLSDSKQNVSLSTATNTLDKFRNNRRVLTKKVFVEDFKSAVSIYKTMNTTNSVMMRFLQSSPVSQIVVVPHSLFYSFMEVENLLLKKKKKIMDVVEFQKATQSKLDNNKWLRQRRQLWMYFIRDSNKVQSFIEEIKLEIMQLRKLQ